MLETLNENFENGCGEETALRPHSVNVRDDVDVSVECGMRNAECGMRNEEIEKTSDFPSISNPQSAIRNPHSKVRLLVLAEDGSERVTHLAQCAISARAIDQQRHGIDIRVFRAASQFVQDAF